LRPGLSTMPVTVCVAVSQPACLKTPSKASFSTVDSRSPAATANHTLRTGPVSPASTRSIDARSVSLSERGGRAVACAAAGGDVVLVVGAAARSSCSGAPHATRTASASGTIGKRSMAQRCSANSLAPPNRPSAHFRQRGAPRAAVRRHGTARLRLRPCQRGVVLEPACGLVACLAQQVRIAQQVRHPERRQARLAGAQEVAGPAQLQIRLRDHEAVGRALQHPEPLKGLGRHPVPHPDHPASPPPAPPPPPPPPP